MIIYEYRPALSDDVLRLDGIKPLTSTISYFSSGNVRGTDANKVTVCDWCFSERSKLLLQALGKGDQL